MILEYVKRLDGQWNDWTVSETIGRSVKRLDGQWNIWPVTSAFSYTLVDKYAPLVSLCIRK